MSSTPSSPPYFLGLRRQGKKLGLLRLSAPEQRKYDSQFLSSTDIAVLSYLEGQPNIPLGAINEDQPRGPAEFSSSNYDSSSFSPSQLFLSQSDRSDLIEAYLQMTRPKTSWVTKVSSRHLRLLVVWPSRLIFVALAVHLSSPPDGDPSRHTHKNRRGLRRAKVRILCL